MLSTYWERIRATREFPALSDVDPASIHGLWPFCVVMKVTGEPVRLEFEHVGKSLKVGYGLLQKMAISGMSGGETVFSNLVSLAHGVLEQRIPARDSGSFHNQWGDEIRYRCIVVPLSDDQQTIDHLLGLAGYLEVKRTDVPGLTVSTSYRG